MGEELLGADEVEAGCQDGLDLRLELLLRDGVASGDRVADVLDGGVVVGRVVVGRVVVGRVVVDDGGAVVVVLGRVAEVVVVVGRVVVDRAGAQAAADAAALAGALDDARGAEEVAVANGARIVRFSRSGELVQVEVSRAGQRAVATAERYLEPVGPSGS